MEHKELVMNKIVSSTELQKNTRNIIDMARTQSEAIVVETYGKPMVVILPFEEYQQYLVYKQRQQEARSARFAQLRQLAEQHAAAAGLDDTEAAALIEDAREESYQRRHTSDVEV
jgi:hypothetical protein